MKIADDERRKILRLYQSGTTVAGIARRFGRSVASIHSIAYSGGVMRPGGRTFKPYTLAEIVEVRRLLADGLTFAKIAERVGRSSRSIRAKLWRLDLYGDSYDSRSDRRNAEGHESGAGAVLGREAGEANGDGGGLDAYD